MSEVRAKFKVVAQTHYEHDLVEIKMSAVCDDTTEENRKFYKYTPSGTFAMQTNNKGVIDHMKPGKFFYLDFTETDK